MDRERILIVEDETVIALHVKSTLAGRGYRVLGPVSSGERAVEIARRERPDAILMDLRLSGKMTGLEAAAEICAEADIPIIYVTAFAEDGLIEHAPTPHSYGYLVKPVEDQELVAALDMALYKHTLDRQLRESEERYRRISELTSDYAYAFRVEPDGALALEWLAGAFTRITGLTPEEGQARGGWAALVHPDDAPIVARRIAAVIGGQPDVSEFRIRTKSGEVRWLRDHAQPVWDEAQRRVVRIYGAARDITERKQAEQALQQSERRYRHITENMADTVWAMDLNLRLSYANPAAERTRGFTWQELENMPLDRHLTPPSLAAAMQAMSDFMAQESLSLADRPTSHTLELEFYRQDGSTFWGEVILTLIRDSAGTPVEILGVGRDISGRRQAERAREQHTRELMALYDTSLELTSRLELPALLSAITERAVKLLNARLGGLYLLTPDGDHLELRASHNLTRDYIGTRLAIGEGLAGRVAETGQPMMVEDYVQWQGQASAYADGPFRRVLAVPLQVDRRIVGVLNVADDEKTGLFEQDQVRLVSLFANQAALAIENARLYQTAQQKLVERRQADQQLRLLSQAVEHSPVSIVITNPAGEIQYVNAKFSELTGYSRAEATGQNPRILKSGLHPPGYYRELWETLLAGREWHGEFQNKKKNGELYWESASISPVTDDQGRISHFVAVKEDITPSKLAQEDILRLNRNLEHSNRDLLALNAIAGTLGQSLDLERILMAALDQVLDMLQFDGGWVHLIDENSHALKLSVQRGWSGPAGDQREPLDRVADQVAQSGEPVVLNPGARAPQPDAGSAPVPTVAAIPIKAKDKTLGVLGIVHRRPRVVDPHEIQLLIAVGHQLGAAVENVRLAAQAAEIEVLRELDQLRSELIANVSHELRTPLGLIKVFATTLLRQDVEFDPQTFREFLGDIAHETDRLEHIVDNLLDLSRLQSGRLRLDLHPTDVGDLVREVMRDPELELAPHHFECQFAGEPLVARCDAKRVEQVVRNLLSNAIKYSPNGGAITVRGQAGQHEILIRVSDHGLGIAADALERIFERFYRAETEATRGIGGVGLGLAVCKGIVESHGGRIWAESTPGRGSTFSFTLPIGAWTSSDMPAGETLA